MHFQTLLGLEGVPTGHQGTRSEANMTRQRTDQNSGPPGNGERPRVAPEAGQVRPSTASNTFGSELPVSPGR